jgi:hypothetical protein
VFGLMAACGGSTNSGSDGPGLGSDDRDAGKRASSACTGGCGESSASLSHATSALTSGASSQSSAATCASAAEAICNAATTCGGSKGELSFQACEVGQMWVSTEACVTQLTANCGADASVTPGNPAIRSPAACIVDVPFTCQGSQAVIPASCVSCVTIAVDAG